LGLKIILKGISPQKVKTNLKNRHPDKRLQNFINKVLHMFYFLQLDRHNYRYLLQSAKKTDFIFEVK
jgi:hypothetical protein